MGSSPVVYRVKLLPKKYNNQIKVVTGKQIAVAVPSKVMIPVATRVVAMFHNESSSNFYSGVVAEPPKITNNYRYKKLLFVSFSVLYCSHLLIYLQVSNIL